MRKFLVIPEVSAVIYYWIFFSKTIGVQKSEAKIAFIAH